MNTRTLPVMPDVQAVREEAVESLMANMGVGRAVVFLRASMAGKTDYVHTRNRLFADETVDSLADKIVRTRQQPRSGRKAKDAGKDLRPVLAT